YYFHQFPVYFLFGNLFILLPVNIIMGLGALVLLPYTAFLASCFEWSLNFTNESLKWIANLPFSGISAIYIQWYDFFFLFLGTILIMLAFDLKNKKILMCALLALILFQASVAINKLECFNQRKVIFYSLKRGYATLFITGNLGWLVTDLNKDHKDFIFHIQPSIELYKIAKLRIISIHDSLDTKLFKINQHQIKFYNYKLLVISPSLNNSIIEEYPSFDGLWIHNNPHLELLTLRKSINGNALFIDASNKAYKANKLASEGIKLGFSTFLSRKDPAYILNLK
ncbi:MAG: hypothetical protein EOO43_13380, partial [Flavobacterium sp.]